MSCVILSMRLALLSWLLLQLNYTRWVLRSLPFLCIVALQLPDARESRNSVIKRFRSTSTIRTASICLLTWMNRKLFPKVWATLACMIASLGTPKEGFYWLCG